MKIKLLISKGFSLLLFLLCFAGINNTVEAQITFINGTACNITVYIGQNDLSTVVPCDLCPINPPVPINIAAGAPPTPIFGQDVCGEDFGWIAWQLTGSLPFGISPNPGLPGGCVPSLPGNVCTFGSTNAFWFFGGGSGPVTVVII